MPYTAGTQGAETNCAAVFMATLDTLLTAAGFVFVEQVVTAPAVCRVYKSPAAANFHGQDWYLFMNRTTDAAITVQFRVAERYNPATHLATYYAPSATTGLSTNADRAVLDATGQAPNSAALRAASLSVSAAGFGYQVNVTPDRFIAATRAGTVNDAMYAGLYDDLQRPEVSPFPLCVVNNLTGATTGITQVASATREPDKVSAGATSNAFICERLGYWATPKDVELFSGGAYMSRTTLLPARDVNAKRGLLRDVWTVWRDPAVNGDRLTATVGGVTQTLTQFRDDFVGSSVYQIFVPAPGATAGTLLGTAYAPPWDDGGYAGVAGPTVPTVPTTGQIWPRGNP